MLKVSKEFGGILLIAITQEVDNYFAPELSYRVRAKSLDYNQVAGTITEEVFKTFASHKFSRIKTWKAKHPIKIRITDGEGNYITDTMQLDRLYQQRLNLLSKEAFGLALYEGLRTMGQKPQVHKLTDMVKSEKTRAQIEANDKQLWVKQIADKATKAAKKSESEKMDTMEELELNGQGFFEADTDRPE